MKCLFEFIDRSVVKINKWEYIPNSKRKLLYICPYVYKGTEIKISDDTSINNGDLVAEIHIDNFKVHELENNYVKLITVFKKELQVLSNTIINERKFNDIKAYHGVTLLYPIAKKQGFTIVDIKKGPKKSFLIIWENILRVVFKKEKIKKKRVRIPKECWISKRKLLEKYIETSGEENDKKDD